MGRKSHSGRDGLVTEARAEELLALDEALEKLAGRIRADSDRGMRYFGGLTVEETAEFLKTPQRTVEREWNMAKAWLYRALSGERSEGENRMNAERWQQINDLFQSLLSVARRTSLVSRSSLSGRPGSAPRGRVAGRLVEQAEHFIESPAFKVTPELLLDDAGQSLVGFSALVTIELSQSSVPAGWVSFTWPATNGSSARSG